MYHVDECKTYALVGLEIHGQVKVIVRVLELLVYQIEQVLLHELNWNVPNHECRLRHDFFIEVCLGHQDFVQINGIVSWSNVDFLLRRLILLVATLLKIVVVVVDENLDGHILLGRR